MNKLIVTLISLVALNNFYLIAQEGTASPPEFPLGSFLSMDTRTNQNIYSSFIEAGLNTAVQFADENTKPFLSNLNVIANNHDYSITDKNWIGYYAASYYSRWESEENQTDSTRVGVKHKGGSVAEWKGVQCWSTKGLTAPACSLVYGPHYRQEKRYKGWTHGCSECVVYTARFNMALDYDTTTISLNENVCVIKVVHRYATIYGPGNWPVSDTVLVADTLKAGDFPQDGNFKIFELDKYQYDSRFIPRQVDERLLGYEHTAPIGYSDSNGDNGIQFWVEWLRDDTLCTLYIDYAEVFDNDGWNDYVSNPTVVVDRIQSYAQSYSNWSNIIYWYSQDEPYTIDAFTPMRVVDSLVRVAGGPPLITAYYPDPWIIVNGDTQIVQYYNMVKPQKLMIDFYPYSKLFYPIRHEDIEVTRNQFQLAHSLQPGFWYVGQGFGLRGITTINR